MTTVISYTGIYLPSYTQTFRSFFFCSVSPFSPSSPRPTHLRYFPFNVENRFLLHPLNPVHHVVATRLSSTSVSLSLVLCYSSSYNDLFPRTPDKPLLGRRGGGTCLSVRVMKSYIPSPFLASWQGTQPAAHSHRRHVNIHITTAPSTR